jgi:hypothetical protein
MVRRTALMALCCAAVVSCSNPLQWVSPRGCEAAERLPPASPRSAASPPLDQWLVRASRLLPGGFAGIDQDGRRTTLLLVHQELDDSAIATARRLGTAVIPVNPDLMEIKGARWSLDELTSWYQYVVSLVPDSDTSTVSIDMHRNAIMIQVPHRAEQPGIAQRLATQHLPCKLVGVELVPPVPRPAN